MYGKKDKPDFLDDVVLDAGPDSSDDEYGAKMSDSSDEEDGGSEEEAQQDRVMAAKSVMKAVTSGDASKLAEALKAFVSACM